MIHLYFKWAISNSFDIRYFLNEHAFSSSLQLFMRSSAKVIPMINCSITTSNVLFSSIFFCFSFSIFLVFSLLRFVFLKSVYSPDQLGNGSLIIKQTQVELLLKVLLKTVQLADSFIFHYTLNLNCIKLKSRWMGFSYIPTKYLVKIHFLVHCYHVKVMLRCWESNNTLRYLVKPSTNIILHRWTIHVSASKFTSSNRSFSLGIPVSFLADS